MNIKQVEEKYAGFVFDIANRSKEEFICFMSYLQKKRSKIQEQIALLFQYEGKMQDMQLGLCNYFPSEYDGDKLLLAYDFVPVFVEKSEHWSFRHVDRQEKEKYKDAYLYAKDVWLRMTEGIDAHNFKIGKMGNDTEVFFTFTVSNIPGKFEIALPIGKKFRESQRNDIFMRPPMQIRILYAMATMEDVWKAIGRTYYIDDVSTLLKTFVETNEYKKYLPSPTIEHRECVDGYEIVWTETQEIPQSLWDAIEKSRLEASVEKEQGID